MLCDWLVALQTAYLDSVKEKIKRNSYFYTMGADIANRKYLYLKGQCHEIFYSGFFTKHLLLVPLDMARQDFKFFRIFEELFEFVINSPVNSYWGVKTPWCIHHWGVVTPRCRGVDLSKLTKETASAKYTRETPLWLNQWGAVMWTLWKEATAAMTALVYFFT